ncbi:Hypothetical protein D9617_10g072080 [Elsinoe fawcettii]|nr:Hypothetical protein D9617_10g072080 [Elsinoe fawcettii]
MDRFVVIPEPVKLIASKNAFIVKYEKSLKQHLILTLESKFRRFKPRFNIHDGALYSAETLTCHMLTHFGVVIVGVLNVDILDLGIPVFGGCTILRRHQDNMYDILVDQNRDICTQADCPRTQSGHGFHEQKILDQHLQSHEDGTTAGGKQVIPPGRKHRKGYRHVRGKVMLHCKFAGCEFETKNNNKFLEHKSKEHTGGAYFACICAQSYKSHDARYNHQKNCKIFQERDAGDTGENDDEDDCMEVDGMNEDDVVDE